jgi:hypothetical protein
MKIPLEIRTAAAAVLLAFQAHASASHFDGSRTVPVHRIPLADEDGQTIIPAVKGCMPFSTKMSCGACHDYEKIHSGYHFSGLQDGRPSEPWIVVDEKSGTQVPADQMNLSAWEFTKRFGTHLPGGGISDPDDKLSDPDARWHISGGLEINCMACHNMSYRQDMTEWAKQIGRENFRWAAVAASGLGDVPGMASRMPDWWDIYMGESPDDKVYRVPPSVNYDETLFDSKNRAWLDIGRPQDSSCLSCHSTHPVGAMRHEVPGDIHTKAGLSCVDCHRNGEDHMTLRGTTDQMSCASCHLETGEHGAPIAAHKGIPPIHFNELTCTACHSGQSVAATPTPIRTSRANRLGIYGRAQWYTDSPFVVEPVFVRNDEGKIEPRRMMWPAFWARMEGDNATPIELEEIEAAAAGILDAQQQVATIVNAFAYAEAAPGAPRFATAGKLYSANIDGGLDLSELVPPADEGWFWEIDNNVVSTIPTFDVNAEEIDYEAEGRITAIIRALASIAGERKITMVSGGQGFVLGEDDFLSKTNRAGVTDGWYWVESNQLTPLVDSFLQRAVADTAGTTYTFNEMQVAAMLTKLGENSGYIANGRLFTLNADGTLNDTDHTAAEPVSWPLGHDVRPAAMALGAHQCTDCHSAGSDFFFGRVTATGPLKTERALTTEMHEFQDVGKTFHKLFGTSFLVRKYLKIALICFASLLALVLLAVGLPNLYKFSGVLTAPGEKIRNPLFLVLTGCIGLLAATGFLFGWPVSAPLNGFPLLIHVGLGALFALVLCIWALIRARAEENRKLRICFWVIIAAGVVLILSIVLAMFPIFGTYGQYVLMKLHAAAAVVTLIAGALAFAEARKRHK